MIATALMIVVCCTGQGMAAAEQDGLFAISVQGGRWWSVVVVGDKEYGDDEFMKIIMMMVE